MAHSVSHNPSLGLTLVNIDLKGWVSILSIRCDAVNFKMVFKGDLTVV